MAPPMPAMRVFFKARDPKALAAWYAKYLGLVVEDFGGAILKMARRHR